MRALVTGASGFIGRHLVRALLEAGHQVSGLLRAGSDRTGLDGMSVVLGDITAPDSLGPAVAQVDVVFHLASLLKMPWKTAFHTVNAEGTKNVAQAVAAATTPATLIVVSSLAAAGPSPPGSPRRPAEPPRPISIYGRVKWAAEQAAASFAQQAPISVVRPPMVFGEGDRSVLQIFRSTQRGVHLVPTWARHQLSLIHAGDLAAALIRVAERGTRLGPIQADGPYGEGVYYASNPVALGYDELGRVIAKAAGFRAPTVLRLPGMLTLGAALGSELVARVRDRATILNVDKWREASGGSWICDPSALLALGWAPRDLDARLSDTAAWYRAQGWLA